MPAPPGLGQSLHPQAHTLLLSFLRRGEIEAQKTPGSRKPGLCVEDIHGIPRFMQSREQGGQGRGFPEVYLLNFFFSSTYSVVYVSVCLSLYTSLCHIRSAEVRRQVAGLSSLLPK